MGPLEILGCRQRTGDSLSSLPNLGCAAPRAGCLVVFALEAARGLKVIRGSLDTPSSPCAQVRSLADCCLVPGIRVWKSRSQETGRTTVPGRFRTASSDAPSFSLESLRRLSQKAPENLVRVGQGSGYPQSGFRQGGKRMRKFYLSYKVEELRCSSGQGPFSNFVILGL